MASCGASGRVLVLALGNELLADDAVALLAARELAGAVGEGVEVREAAQHGMALLEELCGFRAAVILDALCTGVAPPGTVHRFALEDLAPALAPSPHWAGLPEVAAYARAAQLPFPEEVVILAVEAVDLATVGGAPTPAVRAAIPALVQATLAELSRLTPRRAP